MKSCFVQCKFPLILYLSLLLVLSSGHLLPSARLNCLMNASIASMHISLLCCWSAARSAMLYLFKAVKQRAAPKASQSPWPYNWQCKRIGSSFVFVALTTPAHRLLTKTAHNLTRGVTCARLLGNFRYTILYPKSYLPNKHPLLLWISLLPRKM